MLRKVKRQPKRLAGMLYRKLPWYGKILVPFAVVAVGIYFLGWASSLFV